MIFLFPEKEPAFIAAAGSVFNELSLEHFDDGEVLDLENNLQKAIISNSHFHDLYQNLVQAQTTALHLQHTYDLCLSNVIAIFEACITKPTGTNDYYLDERVLITMLRTKLREHPDMTQTHDHEHESNEYDSKEPDEQSCTY
jgi:hypothetical protein